MPFVYYVLLKWCVWLSNQPEFWKVNCPKFSFPECCFCGFFALTAELFIETNAYEWATENIFLNNGFLYYNFSFLKWLFSEITQYVKCPRWYFFGIYHFPKQQELAALKE